MIDEHFGCTTVYLGSALELFWGHLVLPDHVDKQHHGLQQPRHLCHVAVAAGQVERKAQQLFLEEVLVLVCSQVAA